MWLLLLKLFKALKLYQASSVALVKEDQRE